MTDITREELWEAIRENTVVMEGCAKTMSAAATELEHRKALIRKLTEALLEIEEWAEDQYDGPEDKRMGWLIARCQDARGR